MLDLRDTGECIEHFPNSDPDIKYTFYGFEQCKEYSLEQLGITIVSEVKDWNFANKPLTIEFDNHDLFSTFHWSLRARWKDDKELYIGHTENFSVVYLIAEKGHIISGFFDKYALYQEGDSYTRFHISDEGDLVVENVGDVSSTIVISHDPPMVKSANKD